MAIIDDWVKEDPEFKEIEDIVRGLGYVDLKDFLSKNKQKTMMPELTEELINN